MSGEVAGTWNNRGDHKPLEYLRRGIQHSTSRPPTGEDGSDESMPEETRSQRLRRYQNSTQAEISDPDEWADVHYGPEAPNDDGVQEF